VALRPADDFAISPGKPSTADTILFVDCSHDPGQIGIAWRAWDFGDGETAVGASPVHRYATVGEQTVTLTVATLDGRVGSCSKTLAVV